MGERLVFEFMVGVGGRVFSNRNHDAVELPISLEIEHRDNEASRLTLTVWDAPTDEPFPIYNGTPDPYTETDVPVVAYGRWEGEGWVKMFSGLLVAKKAKYPTVSQTTFVALHRSFRLRKRGKVDTRDNISIRDMMKIKAAEEGLKLTVHQSAASDPYLTEPCETMIQAGQSNWAYMDHHFREGGYVTNTVRDDEIVLRVNKSDGPVVSLARGDDTLIGFDVRSEQKREHQAARRKGHSHHITPGRHQHNEEGEDPSRARHVRTNPAALPKRRKGYSRAFFSKHSVKQTTRQLERQGREITVNFRLQPEMRNEERINLSGFGPQISGVWETAHVVHRCGNTTARTEAACTRAR